MDEREKLYEFWRQPAPPGNQPHGYIHKRLRSQALLELIESRRIPKSAPIMEIGCNVGRNLYYLRVNGYTNVAGIEISPNAVEMLREQYPQLADSAIHLGPAEEVLPTLASGAFRLVFTMAVIEHIHPDSEAVFDDMVRVGGSMLAIEPVAGHESHRQHPHNVRQLFEGRGMRHKFTKPMTDFPTLADDSLRNYAAYWFDPPSTYRKLARRILRR